MEPEHVLAFSMLSLLFIGLVSQLLQQRGGKIARAAPFVVIVAVLIITTICMAGLSNTLAAHAWQEES